MKITLLRCLLQPVFSRYFPSAPLPCNYARRTHLAIEAHAARVRQHGECLIFLLYLIMRFSQRIGKTPVRTALQIDTIDDALKNRLWSIILTDFIGHLDSYSRFGGDSELDQICKYLWTEFFSNRIDQIPSYNNGSIQAQGVIHYIEKWYFKAEWFGVYDLIETISKLDVQYIGIFIDACNTALEKEMSNYRIIDSTIVQITSEQEIIAIEEALSDNDEFKSVQTHLKTALDLLANRASPDFRNSIKESISALEALCKILISDDKATLGKALATLETKYGLHPSLKESFSKLYGYSSDAGGIRHAMLESSISVDFDDAKFMLVLCASFINYLRAKFKV